MSRMIEKNGKTVAEAIKTALSALGAREEEAVIEVLDEGEAGGLLGFGRRPAVVRVSVDSDGPSPEERPEEDFLPPVIEEEAACLPLSREQRPQRSRGGRRSASTERTERQERGRRGRSERRREELPELIKDSQAEKIVLSEEEQALCENTALDYLAAILQSLDIHGKMSSYFDEDGSLCVDIAGDDIGQAIGRRGETMDAIQYLTSLAVHRKMDQHCRIILDIGRYRERSLRKAQQQALNVIEKVQRSHRRYALPPMSPAERRQVHMLLADYEGLSTFSEGDEPNRRVVIVPDNERS